VISIRLTGPDGRPLVADTRPPLDRDKAQVWALAGRKRPPAGWPKGRYAAVFTITRAGKPVAEQRSAVAF
jgi:hypothetical protein